MTCKIGHALKLSFGEVLLFCLLCFLSLNKVFGESRNGISRTAWINTGITLTIDAFSGCLNPVFTITDSGDIASIQAVFKGLEKHAVAPEYLERSGLSCREGLGYRGIILSGVGEQPPLWSSFSPWVRICGALVQHRRPEGSIFYHDKKKELQNLVIKIGIDRNLKSDPRSSCGQRVFRDLIKLLVPSEHRLPPWTKLIAGEKGTALTIRDLALTGYVISASMGKTLWTLWAAAGEKGLFFVHYKDNKKHSKKPLTWMHMNGTLGENTIQSVAALKDTLFVGTRDEGIFRSYDGGKSWDLAVSGLPPGKELGSYEPVEQITIRGRKVLALIPSRGIYWSTVEGNDWRHLGPGPFITGSITCFDWKESEILAGSYNGALYRSSDDGLTWDSLSIPDNRDMTMRRPLRAMISQVIIGEESLYAVIPNDCMACSNPAGIRGHILRSADHGKTWEDIIKPIPDVPLLSLIEDRKKLFLGLNYRFSVIAETKLLPGIYYLPSPGNNLIQMDKTYSSCDIRLLEKLGEHLFAVSDSGTVYNLDLADLSVKAISDGTLFWKNGSSKSILKTDRKGVYTLVVSSPPAGLIRLTLRNIRGQVIKQTIPVATSNGSITFLLESGDLSVGRYILSAEFADKRINTGIVVLK